MFLGDKEKKMAYTYGTDEYEQAYKDEVDKRMAEEPKPYIYLTPEWVAMFEKGIQEDATYKEVAKDWEGSVVLHVEAAPEYGLDIDLYVLLDLWHGDCRSARIVPEEVGEAGDFVITGSAERWMDVGRKELDTVKGMMQGKLRLKGNLPTIVRYVKASVRLTDISADVGGRYPDELSPDEVDGLRATVKDLADRFLGITI
jgi:putative sterol carrier protein